MSSEDHPIPFRELVRRLRKFDVFLDEKRNRGAIRKFVGIVEGRKQSYPLHPHSERDEVDRHYLRAIRDRFKIPAERFYAE